MTRINPTHAKDNAMKTTGSRHQTRLHEVRKSIDNIDLEIVRLLKKRLVLSMRAFRIKQKLGLGIRNLAREKFILQNAKREASRRKLPAHDVVAVFQKIIGICRNEQFKVGKKSKS